jgi:hypothetical protein
MDLRLIGYAWIKDKERQTGREEDLIYFADLSPAFMLAQNLTTPFGV